MKIKRIRHYNIAVALEIILLLGFAFFFIVTIITKSVSMYVHPRIIPFMVFAAVAMILIAFMKLGELCEVQERKKSLLPFLFFVIPLLTAFAIPPQAFDSGTSAVGNIQLNSEVREDNESSSIPNDNDITEEEFIEPLTDDETEVGQQLENGIMTMDSSNFMSLLNEVYGNVDDYLGMQIEVIGFVFHDSEQFDENEFVTARLMMVCCAADMQPIGFLCKYNGAVELEADSWVKVCGSIDSTDFNGEIIPFINVNSVQAADKPDEDYIYPY